MTPREQKIRRYTTKKRVFQPKFLPSLAKRRQIAMKKSSVNAIATKDYRSYHHRVAKAVISMLKTEAISVRKLLPKTIERQRRPWRVSRRKMSICWSQLTSPAPLLGKMISRPSCSARRHLSSAKKTEVMEVQP